MLQPQVGGRRGTSSLQLLSLQSCQDEVRKRKSLRSPKTACGRMFSCNHSTPVPSFAAALCSKTAAEAASPVCGCTDRPARVGAQPASTKSVVSDSSCKLFVSEIEVQSSRNWFSAYRDIAQRGRVRRRQTNGHHNIINIHEAKLVCTFGPGT
jgi:hypothetical protein